jgi:hypothetical protein
MPAPFDVIVTSLGHADVSARVIASNTIVASPALAAETIICTVEVTANLWTKVGVFLVGWCAFTAGTSGVSANLRIRQTSVTGTVVAASGAVTVVATDLYSPSIVGVDASPVLPNQIYDLTLTIGSGGAISTVSAVGLLAIAV